MKNIIKLKKKTEDINRIKKTTEWLIKNPIKCNRYSNKLDEKIPIPHTYTSTI